MILAPRGCLAKSGDIFDYHNLRWGRRVGCYGHQVGRSQSSCSISYSVQDNPPFPPIAPHTNNSPAPNFSSADTEKPSPRPMVLRLELHQNPLEGLLKTEVAGLHPQSCDSEGLGRGPTSYPTRWCCCCWSRDYSEMHCLESSSQQSWGINTVLPTLSIWEQKL